MNMYNLEISLIVSVATAIIAVAGFYLTQRKERDKEVIAQTKITTSLENIIEIVSEMKIDLKEVKSKVMLHDGRIDKLEAQVEELKKQLLELYKQVQRKA